MLRITIELISAADGSSQKLGMMDIYNTGEHTDPKVGTYRGRLYIKNSWQREPKTGRHGIVEHYPRQSKVVWVLILRMLKNMFPEEK